MSWCRNKAVAPPLRHAAASAFHRIVGTHVSKHVKPWLLPAMCLLPAVAALGQASPARRDTTLRLNDIAAIGTHNSYKLPMPAATIG